MQINIKIFENSKKVKKKKALIFNKANYFRKEILVIYLYAIFLNYLKASTVKSNAKPCEICIDKCENCLNHGNFKTNKNPGPYYNCPNFCSACYIDERFFLKCSECFLGFFSKNFGCFKCDEKCKVCSDTPENCQICANGFYFIEGLNKCTDLPCPNGYFPQEKIIENNEIINKNNINLLNLNKSVNGFGNYINNKHDLLCKKCSSKCSKCKSIDKCTECARGYRKILIDNTSTVQKTIENKVDEKSILRKNFNIYSNYTNINEKNNTKNSNIKDSNSINTKITSFSQDKQTNNSQSSVSDVGQGFIQLEMKSLSEIQSLITSGQSLLEKIEKLTNKNNILNEKTESNIKNNLKNDILMSFENSLNSENKDSCSSHSIKDKNNNYIENNINNQNEYKIITSLDSISSPNIINKFSQFDSLKEIQDTEFDCISDLICKEGEFFDSNLERCSKCDDSCQICIETSKNCIKCADNFAKLEKTNFCISKSNLPNSHFYDKITNTFETCALGCIECEDNLKCLKCKNRFYLDDNFLCQICDEKCEICEMNPLNCLVCKEGFLKLEGENKCLIECPSEKYYIEDNSFNNNNNILNPSHITKDIANNIFISSFDNKRFCKKCNKYCANCKSKDKCSSCIPGLTFIKETGKCELFCDDGFYANYENNQNKENDFNCLKCDVSCFACDNNKLNCKNCQKNFFQLETSINEKNFKCYEKCPIGFYLGYKDEIILNYNLEDDEKIGYDEDHRYKYRNNSTNYSKPKIKKNPKNIKDNKLKLNTNMIQINKKSKININNANHVFLNTNINNEKNLKNMLLKKNYRINHTNLNFMKRNSFYNNYEKLNTKFIDLNNNVIQNWNDYYDLKKTKLENFSNKITFLQSKLKNLKNYPYKINTKKIKKLKNRNSSFSYISNEQPKRDLICRSCTKYCDLCEYPGDQCKKCKENYFLLKPEMICINICQKEKGFYFDEKDNTCNRCDPSCKTCENSSKNCIECNSDFIKFEKNFVNLNNNIYDTKLIKKCDNDPEKNKRYLIGRSVNDAGYNNNENPNFFYLNENFNIENSYYLNNMYKINFCIPRKEKITGYFLNQKKNLFSPCDISCLECNNEPNQCIKCNSGYFNLVDDLSKTKCFEGCPKSYYLNEHSYICEYCNKSCSECFENPDACLTCSEGYYKIYETSKCFNYNRYEDLLVKFIKDNSKNSHHKHIYLNPDDLGLKEDITNKVIVKKYNTDINNENYYYNKNIPLLTNQDRSLHDKKDINYSDSFVKIEDEDCKNTKKELIIDIKDYYFDKLSNNFKPCAAFCFGCRNSESNCILCSDGYTRSLVDPSKCIKACKNGFYMTIFGCMKCSDECKECEGNDKNCLFCNDNYYLFFKKIQSETEKNFECLDKCPKGYFADYTNKICLNCDKSCGECLNKSDNCLNCNLVDGYLPLEDRPNICLIENPTGYFKNVPENMHKKCPESCLNCLSKDKCINCLNSNYNKFFPFVQKTNFFENYIFDEDLIKNFKSGNFENEKPLIKYGATLDNEIIESIKAYYNLYNKDNVFITKIGNENKGYENYIENPIYKIYRLLGNVFTINLNENSECLLKCPSGFFSNSYFGMFKFFHEVLSERNNKGNYINRLKP